MGITFIPRVDFSVQGDVSREIPPLRWSDREMSLSYSSE